LVLGSSRWYSASSSSRGSTWIQYGVPIVGEIPTGLPALQVPIIRPADLLYLVTEAAGIVFLAGGESIASARAIAARHHQQIDSNQELIALGAANVGASLLQGFSVDASLSTTATADEAGARTQLSSIITARLVLVTILALAPHPALDRVPPARGSNNSLHRTSSRTGAPTSMDMAKRALGGGV
jgi:MFS superfamily sulfate permease-like transporter